MEFEYTDTIYIYEHHIIEMKNRVNDGEDFEEVFEDIMSGYEDVDYYNSELIYDKVKEVIMKGE